MRQHVAIMPIYKISNLQFQSYLLGARTLFMFLCWMCVFFLLQQFVHIPFSEMLKLSAAFPERCSSVHPKQGNHKEIICCLAEWNNFTVKLQNLQSLIEKWSKIRIAEGLLKAFLTVEIGGFFQIYFSWLLPSLSSLQEMLKDVPCSLAGKREVICSENWRTSFVL